jgi:hypothetical protein
MTTVHRPYATVRRQRLIHREAGPSIGSERLRHGRPLWLVLDPNLLSAPIW